MAGEVAFVELGVADPTLARTFYAGLFGWTFSPGPGEGGLLISGLGVAGGLHGQDPHAQPLVYFRAGDMEAALRKVRELGGSVESGAPDRAPHLQERLGRFALCRDDQGSAFGLHQPPA